MSQESNVSSSTPRTKVGRLIHEYDLEDLSAVLEQAWIGEGREQQSLRELATLFNERIVQAAMTDAGMNPLDGEASNVYNLLAGEDTTRGEEVRAERRLDREGIDVDTLRESFVSHQAIHTYLTDVREVEYSQPSSKPEKKTEAVERLIGRTRSVSDGVVDWLAENDEVDIGEFDVSASVNVTCRSCGSRYSFSELVERGSCRCQDGE